MNETVGDVYLPDFSKLAEECLDRMKRDNYSRHTLQHYSWTLRHLERYMEERGIIKYNSEIGYGFINCLKQSLSKRTVQDKAKAVHYLDRYCNEVYHQKNPEEPPTLPDGFQTAMNEYLALCHSKGSAEETIKKKRWACLAFFEKLISTGCTSFYEMDVDTIRKVAPLLPTISIREQVRPFLKYLFSQGELMHDYSIMIPHINRPKPIPCVYSPEEIAAVEKSLDRSTPNGKRDHAIFVLISRYGLRPSDVANLRFQNIDFQTKRITLNQVKTKEFLSLPLLEVVEAAIKEYVEQVRKKGSSSGYIFLTAFAPYRPLSRAEISTIIRFAIRRSGIEINGRKMGPCALRSSLASSMVNDGHSYEAVRKVLGHKDSNVIRHYARLDIEVLRRYALNPVAPQGGFANFLERGFEA